jgi:8-oxo-dGTP pyrophosphatase MutT (NUDIX family)
LKPEDAEVLAAGGLVWRRAGDGTVEVAVVHRPRYDDWSLPKGKLDEGEDFEAAALREVEEETGLQCRLGRALGDTSYNDRKGRRKLVRYFEMAPEDGDFEPNEEVDELRWVGLAEARGLLDYDFDRELVERAEPELS